MIYEYIVIVYISLVGLFSHHFPDVAAAIT